MLCGRVKDYGAEKAEGLTRPPQLPTNPDLLYDSVQVWCGMTHGPLNLLLHALWIMPYTSTQYLTTAELRECF